jgi:hypothetical protein
MAKISSRTDENQERVDTLQFILTRASRGMMGPEGSTSPVTLVDDIDGLIDQTEQLLTQYESTLEMSFVKRALLIGELTLQSVALEETRNALANLIGNIDYDECLDSAARDLADGFFGRDTADVTADGSLVFSERTVVTVEDIKPILRSAIVEWIERKMAQ